MLTRVMIIVYNILSSHSKNYVSLNILKQNSSARRSKQFPSYIFIDSVQAGIEARKHLILERLVKTSVCSEIQARKRLVNLKLKRTKQSWYGISFRCFFCYFFHKLTLVGGAFNTLNNNNKSNPVFEAFFTLNKTNKQNKDRTLYNTL